MSNVNRASASPATNRDSRIVEGTVRVQLPSGLYDVEIDGRYHVTAHLGGMMDRNFMRVLVGDRVIVELTQRDLTRGRIVKKV